MNWDKLLRSIYEGKGNTSTVRGGSLICTAGDQSSEMYWPGYGTHMQINFKQLTCNAFWHVPPAEHQALKNWPTEFNTLKRLLKCSRIFTVHITWLHGYINRSRHPIWNTICSSKTPLYKPERTNSLTCNPIQFPISGVRRGLGQTCWETGKGCNVGILLVAQSEANWLVAIPPIQFCSLKAALATRQDDFLSTLTIQSLSVASR